ncbi:uncharacterized protein LODBEIA_P18980 [Lodderomyces beijingensis]|uniref:Thiaminase-2/PQQC domain-containing protein n=1 Tax=Lodderomyces beijingensis TaxID=1775926 RepID=A0ABP0ZHN3_9ASCO
MSWLVKDSETGFAKSISHPLTTELCQGDLADYVLYTYLVQDLKFFEFGLNVLGKTLALCDDSTASIRLAKQIGFLAHDENTYFRDTLAELETAADLAQVAKLKQDNSITLAEVQGYIDYLKYMTFECDSYVELITFCYAMEKVYLGWVEYNRDKGQIATGLAAKFQNWIDLHSGDHFVEWVDFLCKEVERTTTTPEAREVSKRVFDKAVALEIDFFESCYNYRG